MMDFLPMPHSVEWKEGLYHLPNGVLITLMNTAPTALLYAKMLKQDIRRYAGLDAEIRRGQPKKGDLLLTVTDDLPADHHQLEVDAGGVTLTAGSDEALLHAVTTLGQLIQRHGALLPCLRIEDYPDLPNRGYYLDCARGRVPTLATLKQYADILCRYKINQWQLYIEHSYLFRDLTEAWHGDTPLTAEEIMELDAYCRARHIELVPSLSSFGHMYKILSTRSYADYCELENSTDKAFSFLDLMRHHTVNVSHPDVMDWVKGLITEYRALFTSKQFNICCDETFDLGKGRSAKLAEEMDGSHAMYVDYVSKLCRWLLDQGVTPMIWGDILVHDPASYTAIPQGTICLNWGYLPNQRENEIRDLAEMGAVQYACPGVCTWNQLIPLFEDSFRNIRAMCSHAHKYSAIGLLNTDWGDFGHVCHPWFSLPGILYGAAFAWNAAEMPFEEVNAAVSLFAYGDRTGAFMNAFAHLSRLETYSWRQAVMYFQEDMEQYRPEIFTTSTAEKVGAADRAITDALTALDRAAPHMDSSARAVMRDIHLAAEGVRLWNEIGLYVLEAVEKHGDETADGNALAVRLERWFYAYQQAWREVSKESTLHNLTALMTDYANLLRDTHRAKG